jgi:stage V sporulation protein B
LKLALVTGAPFAVIMFVLAEPLCLYIYNQEHVGIMLKMMAPVALFIYFQAPLQAALQALDRPGSALVNTFTGSAVKLALIYLLASKPELGIRGAIMAININIVLVTLLHWNSVVRLLKFTMQMTDFFKVGLAMVLTGICCYGVMNVEWNDNEFIRFICTCILGILIYLLLIVLLKLVDSHDLVRIRNLGKKILRRT